MKERELMERRSLKKIRFSANNFHSKKCSYSSQVWFLIGPYGTGALNVAVKRFLLKEEEKLQWKEEKTNSINAGRMPE